MEFTQPIQVTQTLPRSTDSLRDQHYEWKLPHFNFCPYLCRCAPHEGQIKCCLNAAHLFFCASTFFKILGKIIFNIFDNRPCFDLWYTLKNVLYITSNGTRHQWEVSLTTTTSPKWEAEDTLQSIAKKEGWRGWQLEFLWQFYFENLSDGNTSTAASTSCCCCCLG